MYYFYEKVGRGSVEGGHTHGSPRAEVRALLLSSFLFSIPSAPTSRELGWQHQPFAVFTHVHTLSAVLSSSLTMLADCSKSCNNDS